MDRCFDVEIFPAEKRSKGLPSIDSLDPDRGAGDAQTLIAGQGDVNALAKQLDANLQEKAENERIVDAARHEVRHPRYKALDRRRTLIGFLHEALDLSLLLRRRRTTKPN